MGYVKLPFSYAKNGDKVWHSKYGWGVISKAEFGDVFVDFNGTVKRCTHSGFDYEPPFDGSERQALFWGEYAGKGEMPPVPDNVTKREKPTVT